MNSVTSMTTFLTQQSVVASSLGRTEYQLLLMKMCDRDGNVKVNRGRPNIVVGKLLYALYEGRGVFFTNVI